MDDMVRRAKTIDLDTIVLTLDVPVEARRERNLRNGFALPYRPSPVAILDAIRHPVWLWEHLRHGGMPMLEGWVKYAREGATAVEVAALFKHQTPDPSQTWDDVKRVRDNWPGSLILKGVLDPEDARIAQRLGVDGLVISNHGGRQLDRAPAPIWMVGRIRAAVGDKMILMLDGGVRRGSDVVCALCAGADFVLVGRSTLYGAVADREAGVLKVIDILEHETSATLTQLGCRALSELSDRLLVL